MNNQNASASGVRILMAEDSPTQSLLLQNILRRHGFELAVARDGLEALDKAREQRPTLVITDIQMPRMDGYELCRAIKSDASLHNVPVMLLTSLSAPEDIIRGLESGADNFVVKPYEEDFLCSRIDYILANQKISAGGPEQGIAIHFAGHKYLITSDRHQILNLLLTTYETALQTNDQLRQAHQELKAAQAQLIEAEKLQSVGRLAGGVAHEVRNPLAILDMGVTFLSSGDVPADKKLILDEMKEAVRRANVVITSLMDLSSPRQIGMKGVDINGVINRALEVLQTELSQRRIEVKRALAPSLPPCRADVSKIEQAILNILSNAADAMPEGGALTVQSHARTLDASDVAWEAGDRSGARLRKGLQVIVVSVEDSGRGIPDENLSKLFEPFFTTKPTGKGMGLGLTVAKKIIDLHGGRIRVENRPDGGVIATLMLKCEIGPDPGPEAGAGEPLQ